MPETYNLKPLVASKGEKKSLLSIREKPVEPQTATRNSPDLHEILPDPEREVGAPSLMQLRRRKLPPRPRVVRTKVVKVKPPLADPRLQQFENYLIARNRSRHTIEQYILHAESFLKVADSASLDPFTNEAVDRYLVSLARDGMGANTRRWMFYLIRTLFRAHRKEWGFEPGEAPKEARKVVHVFTEADLIKLERTAEELGLKWQAMIRLENSTGLRRIEIQRLNISNFEPPYLTFVETAKGGNVIRRKLDPMTIDILQKYIAQLTATRRRADMDALFIDGKGGGRLSVDTLTRYFIQIRRRAGVKGQRAGFHAARRRRVTQLYDAGLSGAQLTQVMGWKDPTTYLNYVHEDPKETEEKMERVHPYFIGPKDGFDKAQAVVEEAGEKPKPRRA
jgi:site-specific recombinase XerD